MPCDINNFRLPDTEKGCTWDGFTWELTDPDGSTEWASTLVSARFQMQDEDGVSVFSKSSTVNGEITLNTTTADAWSITVESVLMTVAAGTYTYALETTDAGGRIKPQLKGAIRITPEPIV